MGVLRVAFRAECEAEDRPCWMCGQPIAYGIPDQDDSFQLDHYFTVSAHPELQEDPANFRASHARCNRQRGDGAPAPTLGSLSRSW
jgi:HNH endonuclease